MRPVGIVGGVPVRLPVVPREEHDQDQNRDDDEQHQRRRGEDDVALLGGDIAGRLENDEIAAAQDERQGERGDGAQGARRPGSSGRSAHACRNSERVKTSASSEATAPESR